MHAFQRQLRPLQELRARPDQLLPEGERAGRGRRRIRDDAGILTGTVGLITEAKEADDIITGGDADLVLLGANCCASRTGH